MQKAETSNPAILLETDEYQIIERAEARNAGIPLYCAHWHIFIPTLVIGLLYLLAWIFLALSGKADTSMARLFILVMAIGVPLLTVHAFLRYQTIRLQLGEKEVLCHTGWPRELPVRIPFNVIKQVYVRKGLAGRLMGGGTLFIELETGGEITIPDLVVPHDAKARIEQELRQETIGSFF